MLAPLTKTCTLCKVEKPTFEFHGKKSGKAGKSSRCKTCTTIINAEYRAKNPGKIKENLTRWYKKNRHKAYEYHKNRYQTPHGRAVNLLKAAQMRRPEGFTLTLEYVEVGIERGYCAATGIAFDLTVNRKEGMTRHPYAPSLDKIDPKLPYTNENTRVVIWQYNMMKGELSDADVLVLARVIVERAGG